MRMWFSQGQQLVNLLGMATQKSSDRTNSVGRILHNLCHIFILLMMTFFRNFEIRFMLIHKCFDIKNYRHLYFDSTGDQILNLKIKTIYLIFTCSNYNIKCIQNVLFWWVHLETLDVKPFYFLFTRTTKPEMNSEHLIDSLTNKYELEFPCVDFKTWFQKFQLIE